MVLDDDDDDAMSQNSDWTCSNRVEVENLKLENPKGACLDMFCCRSRDFGCGVSGWCCLSIECLVSAKVSA